MGPYDSGGRTVTAADLQPYGWRCEHCPHSFVVGDLYFGVLTHMSEEGIPIEGDYRCEDCYETEMRYIGRHRTPEDEL